LTIFVFIGPEPANRYHHRAALLALRSFGEALPSRLAADAQRSADVGPTDAALAQDFYVQSLVGGDILTQRLDPRDQLQQLLGDRTAQLGGVVEPDSGSIGIMLSPLLRERVVRDVDALVTDENAVDPRLPPSS